MSASIIDGIYAPGATVIGIRCRDGVVLAAEKRVTYGFMLMSKSGKKVFKITDRLGIACAGIIADMQALARLLAAEINLFELECRCRMKVRSAAKLLSVILFNRRLMPYFAESMIGGVDDEGPHLYILDVLGSLIEDRYAALGTGARIAIGIVEREYRDEMLAEEAKELAFKAIAGAAERDAVSGDGVDILTITNDGLKEEFHPLTLKM